MKYSLTEEAFRKLICSIRDKLNNHKHSITDVDGLDDLLNNGGIAVEETDPTVPSWAKEPTKPTYTADEVGALPNTTSIPTKVSELQNDSGYLSKIPSEYVTETKLGEHTSNTVSHITTNERTSWNAKANVDDIPTKISQLTDDVGIVKTINNIEPDNNGNIELDFTVDKYFTSTNSNTLTWDGNTAGLPNIGNADFKVYGEVPTLAEASEGGYFKYEDGGEIKTFTFTVDNISAWNDDIYVIYGDDFGEILVASVDNATGYDIVFPEKGVYISSYSSKYISEIMFNGYEFATQVLKGECLPKHEHSWRDIKDPLFGEVKSGNGDTVVSDKVVYGNYHKVNDAVPTLADINKGIQLTYHWVEDGKVSRNSRTFDSTDQYYRVSETTAGIIITYDGTPLVVISFTGSSNIGGWTFEGITEAGTYFRQDDYYCTYSLTISEYTGYPYVFEKIPERYLPEDYIKQLIKEVIAEIGGTDTDGLQDLNGNYLYDILNNKLIAKE